MRPFAARCLVSPTSKRSSALEFLAAFGVAVGLCAVILGTQRLREPVPVLDRCGDLPLSSKIGLRAEIGHLRLPAEALR